MERGPGRGGRGNGKCTSVDDDALGEQHMLSSSRGQAALQNGQRGIPNGQCAGYVYAKGEGERTQDLAPRELTDRDGRAPIGVTRAPGGIFLCAKIYHRKDGSDSFAKRAYLGISQWTITDCTRAQARGVAPGWDRLRTTTMEGSAAAMQT